MPKKGDHVMLAVRRKRNLADENHIVVAVNFLEDAVEHARRVLLVSGKELFIGLDDPFGRVAETLARGIVAGPAQKNPHGRLGLLARRAREE